MGRPRADHAAGFLCRHGADCVGVVSRLLAALPGETASAYEGMDWQNTHCAGPRDIAGGRCDAWTGHETAGVRDGNKTIRPVTGMLSIVLVAALPLTWH